MKKSVLFFSLIWLSMLNIVYSQVSLTRLNPRASAFLLSDGEFLGTKGVMVGSMGAVAVTFLVEERYRFVEINGWRI